MMDFDILYCVKIEDNFNSVVYRCTMDEPLNKRSPELLIKKEVFKKAYEYEEKLLDYIIECLQNKKIIFFGTKYTGKITFGELNPARIVGAKYILEHYINNNNKIPKEILSCSKIGREKLGIKLNIN